MSEQRIISKIVVDSDMFLEMPISSQALYFHLIMRADDDGFVGNPLSIQRMIGARDDDMRLLVKKKYIIPFESGIVAIRHWKMHVAVSEDRYEETIYRREKKMILADEEYEPQKSGLGVGQNILTQNCKQEA